jgi:serpin B
MVPFSLSAKEENKTVNKNAKPDLENKDSKGTKEIIGNPSRGNPVPFVVQGIKSFTFDLFRYLRAKPGNLLVSPYGISTGLMMIYPGSRERTLNQMRLILHLDLNDQDMNQGIFALKNLLTGSGGGGGVPRFYMSNALWMQRGKRLLPTFQELMDSVWRGSFKLQDFAMAPDKARYDINSWLKVHSIGRLYDVLAAEDINRETRIILTSSVYLKGSWLRAFDPGQTRIAPFFTDSAATVTAMMMQDTSYYPYRRYDAFSLLQIPYAFTKNGGTQLVMYVLLPHKIDGLGEIEQRLTHDKWIDWAAGLEERKVTVSLPKFSIDDTVELSGILTGMGMGDAFNHAANFSGIAGVKEFVISKVFHKAYISFDEEGSDSIAIAKAPMVSTIHAKKEEPMIFLADHPFLFLIVDKVTQTVLFMGRLTSPMRN